MFDNEFRKSGPIFIILSPGDMLLHYLVKAENPKMSQRNRATLRVTEYFAKSLKVI